MPKLALLSHYFYPDDVHSARHFEDFGCEMVKRGWEVEVFPCNRACRDESKSYPKTGEHNGVRIHRIWRPNFKQATGMGRILNAIWMSGAWSLLACRRRDRIPDVVVIGTDPILSVLAGYWIKTIRPKVRIVHWCLDLFPEAAFSDGMLQSNSLMSKVLRRMLSLAYGSCDIVADLGCCMRRLLDTYPQVGRQVTLGTWALFEPPEPVGVDAEVRRHLFDDAPLGLLYSGTFGRAHSADEFHALAKMLRNDNVRFCFSVRGNREAELRETLKEESNIRFAGYADESELGKRLGAADIQLVSLRPEWTGVAVPAKFFGCLAVGRPVIYAGSRDSHIARIILNHKVGWVLDKMSMDSVTSDLRILAKKPDELKSLQKHCHRTYQENYCKQRTMDGWQNELAMLLALSGDRADS